MGATPEDLACGAPEREGKASMIGWWRDLSLGKKLHVSIQLVLLTLLPLAHLWVMDRLEERMLADARQRAEESATSSLLSLNAMMLSGAISNPDLRAAFVGKMSRLGWVKDFYLTRGDAIRAQFGGSTEAEHGGDALDRKALETGETQYGDAGRGERIMRVVMPFVAKRDYYGTNCMHCHHVSEGTALGAVSLTLDLGGEYHKLEMFGALLLAGQVALQLLLFLIIGWIIRNVTHSVVELESAMNAVSETGDFSRRAAVRGGDEIGHIARVFNGFLGQIESLYRELAAKMLALEKYRDHTEEELRIGSEIMSRITETYSSEDRHVRMNIRPASHYSGDLILVSRTPDGKLHILLADAVGHGLVAAINLLPLGQVFDAMSKKGFRVGRIAEEMSAKIHRLMPPDRFVAAVLVSIDFGEQVIEMWNGGAPAPLLMARDGKVLRRWPSRNLPLGVQGRADSPAEVEIFHYEGDCQLYMFSDGMPEAESPEGMQFGTSQIEALLSRSAPEARFDELMRSLDEHLGGGKAHDDVSLAMVSIRASDEPEPGVHSREVTVRGSESGQWRMSFSFSAEELKYLDVVPMLTQMVENFRTTAEHHAVLFTIVSELFNNALDHGVLKLDSGIKQGTDGFENYLLQRALRLQQLEHASIEVEIERVMIDGENGVRVCVRDSGEGFAFGGVLSKDGMALTSDQHGRGLALVRDMASSLEFRRNGSEVIAYYICS